MFTRMRLVPILAITAALVFFPTSISSAQDARTLDCDGAESVIAFPYNGYGAGPESVLVVGNAVNYPTTLTVSAALPAGTYDVVAGAYDGYFGRSNTPAQDYEEYVLQFLDAGGAVVATSAMSGDLVDFTEEASWRGSVGRVVLDRDVTAVRAVHAHLGNAAIIAIGQAQSVQPTCLGTTLVPPPTTTTTTVAPTTTIASPTTSIPVTSTTTTTTTTVPTQVLPEVEEMPDPDPVVGNPTFTG